MKKIFSFFAVVFMAMGMFAEPVTLTFKDWGDTAPKSETDSTPKNQAGDFGTAYTTANIKDSIEGADFLDGMLGVNTDFLVLQSQHHGAVERVEASLNLVFTGIHAPFPQFHDKGQHLIVFAVVERIFGALQQHGVQFAQLLHHQFVDLQMSALAASLLVHHPHQVAQPVGHFLLLLFVVVEAADVFSSKPPQIAVVGPDDVFHLPLVEQVFGDVVLSQFP